MKAGGILVVCVLIFSPCSACVNGRYFPRYHLAPQSGWMNDPNGFSYLKKFYHMFYQYNPESSLEPGTRRWGHARSRDLFHWEHLPIALKPDQWYDQNGTFSGSAIVENDIIYMFYTGNVNVTGKNPIVGQFQAIAYSDGINVAKFECGNPIIEAKNHQPNIRDPKVWKHKDTYYMVLGNSYDHNTKGQVLIYSSLDRIEWKERGVLDKSNGSLGYMWECPDFFKLGDKFVFLFSPQGLKAQGDMYRNLYQTGYIIGTFDYSTLTFKKETEFRELNHGHDTYATQSMEDPFGRRIAVDWVNTWEHIYPDRRDGWSGLLSIPKTFTLTDDLRLLQTPVKEIESAVGENLYSGEGKAGTSVALPDKTAKVHLEWSSPRNIEVIIESQNKFESVKISYDCDDGRVVLDRGGDDGVRRAPWNPRGHFYWTIYIDASSVELFCGDSEVLFTSRYFPNGKVTVRLGDKTNLDCFTVHAMKRTVQVPGSCS